MKHHIPFLKHLFPRQWLFLKKHIEMGEEDLLTAIGIGVSECFNVN